MTHGPGFWLPNIVQPIGTVFIGVAGFFIARRQWRVSNEKFRFDLYEKRFDIYKAASSEINYMLQQGEDNIDIDCIERLESVNVEARLLFGHAVAWSLQEATTAARRLFGIKKGGIEYRLQTETLDLQDKLFHKIAVAGTDTLTVMKDFIDFSEIGRPVYFAKPWRYRRKFADLITILRRRFMRKDHSQ